LVNQGKPLIDNFYEKSNSLIERILTEFDNMIKDSNIVIFNWSFAIERIDFHTIVTEKMDKIRDNQLEIFL